MRLPPIENRPATWSQSILESWERLLAQGQQLESTAGHSDAFEKMLVHLREMANTGRFDRLQPLLARRLVARALTWLWLHDEMISPQLLNVSLLDTLIAAQQPRLTRITLLQLVQLYFRSFDRLDEYDKSADKSLRETLEAHLFAQLQLLPELRLQTPRPDALSTLKREGSWLIGLHGPLTLAQRIRNEGQELAKVFTAFGLAGFDTGRYGSICRAHFYLETLRQLAPGEWNEVLDELLKPAASKAPYEGNKRIGHMALEILIDRAGDEPGETWQNFILSLAGDPRIASSTPNYREWWMPLGEVRINRVRGWLSREDLRLFLQAVEQYGQESGNRDLQRMFPARQIFLNGLFNLGFIRYTRLMLGSIAHQSIRRILSKNVQTSFARLAGSMGDKAVIYLDCGDFHLVEGSHSFKMWVYLAQPGPSVKSYERNVFAHSDLTRDLPRQYQTLYPNLGYETVTHNGMWQHKVFDFLADNGIAIDIEKLLSKQDYHAYLSKYGMPVVAGSKRQVPTPGQPSPIQIPTPSSVEPPMRKEDSSLPQPFHQAVPISATSGQKLLGVTRRREGDASIATQAPLVKHLLTLKPFELQVLSYFAANPGDKVRYAAKILKVEAREIHRLLYGPLQSFCVQDDGYGWSVRASVVVALEHLPTDK